MLVQSLLDLDVRNSSGRTPLDLAAFKGHVECVDVLINQGASILVKDYILKRTPIHAAGTSNMHDLTYHFPSNTLLFQFLFFFSWTFLLCLSVPFLSPSTFYHILNGKIIIYLRNWIYIGLAYEVHYQQNNAKYFLFLFDGSFFR